VFGIATGSMNVFPETPSGPRATADVPIRYEDITQDGRFRLEALSNALGETVWKGLLNGHPSNAALRAQGIVPILTRYLAQGASGPFPMSQTIRSAGTFEFTHSISPTTGEVDRLLLRMWVELFGPTGRTHGPPPEGAGTLTLAGRVFAEHVLTRPFGPAAERKVVRVDAPGLPGVPEARSVWLPPAEILNLPAEARFLEPAPSQDPLAIVFGLCHTDSNQHVNSLVYPRLFEEAAIRRFAALGRTKPVLARFTDVGFRKPFFAGDRASIVLQAFAESGRLGAVGAFVPEDPTAKPHAFLRMVFES
jgi:hypothetical protein